MTPEALKALKALKGGSKPRHGHARHIDGTQTPTYRSWCSMLTRCNNPNREDKYRSRGITVCERWLDFDNFLADMGVRPRGTTLERENNNGNYEPTNCRWATPVEQARNRRNTRLTYAQAVDVAVRRLRGENALSIARDYGISESLPREIGKGRSWKDALATAKIIVEGIP